MQCEKALTTIIDFQMEVEGQELKNLDNCKGQRNVFYHKCSKKNPGLCDILILAR